MNPVLVLVVLVGLVTLATALGFAWKSQQGRVHVAHGHTVIRAKDVPGMRRFGSGATLLQFSTEVCSPCKVTHRVLDGIAAENSSVTHVDLDVTRRPELAAQFHIMQTPTTLILDRRGVVRARIGGAPRIDSLRAELDRILVGA
ncbi:MAG: thioredoxin family protein [Rhodoglobus sp.]